MKKLLLDALEEAARQDVVKLFNVLLTSLAVGEPAALQRFETGIGNCLDAYEKAYTIIRNKCDD